MAAKARTTLARFWCRHWRALLRTGLVLLLVTAVLLLANGQVDPADGRAAATLVDDPTP